MIVARVTLVDYYRTLIPAAREAGHKIVLTALARKGDSEELYKDVQGNWASLHDVTGPDILFVFAGEKAAAVVNQEDFGTKDSEKPGYFVASDHVATTGKQVPSRQITPEELAKASVIYPSPQLPSGEDIASNHTLQIREFAKFLGIEQTQLPCLAVTVIGPSQTSSPPIVIVPMSEIERSNIYLFVRNLAVRLERAFADIDRIQKFIALAKMANSQPRADPHYLARLRRTVRADSRELDSSSASDAVCRILALTGAEGRWEVERRLCFQHVQTLRQELHHHDIVSETRRLIDCSFRPAELSLAFDDRDQKIETDTNLNQLLQQESDAWQCLEEDLKAAIDEPRKQQEELRQSAIQRLIIVGIVGFVLLVPGIALAIHFGQGSNVVQRLVSDLLLIALVTSAYIAIGGYAIGRERLTILGWPFETFFRKKTG